MNNSHNDFESVLRQATRRHTAASDLEFRIMARYERERRLQRCRTLRRMAAISVMVPLTLLLLSAIVGRLASGDRLQMYGGVFCVVIAGLYIFYFISQVDVISDAKFRNDTRKTDNEH